MEPICEGLRSEMRSQRVISSLVWGPYPTKAPAYKSTGGTCRVISRAWGALKRVGFTLFFCFFFCFFLNGAKEIYVHCKG